MGRKREIGAKWEKLKSRVPIRCISAHCTLRVVQKHMRRTKIVVHCLFQIKFYKIIVEKIILN